MNNYQFNIATLIFLAAWAGVYPDNTTDADATRLCYICSDNRPGSKCENNPTTVDVGPIKLACKRKYCYAQWNLIDNTITFVSRGCENKDFGNKCVRAYDGQQLVCYHTCATELCNNITQLNPFSLPIYDTENQLVHDPNSNSSGTAPNSGTGNVGDPLSSVQNKTQDSSNAVNGGSSMEKFDNSAFHIVTVCLAMFMALIVFK